MATVTTTQAEIRLARLIETEELNRQKAESLLGTINAREDGKPNDIEEEHLLAMRETGIELQQEIKVLAEDVKSSREAIETSKALRRAMAGAEDGVEESDDGIMYRDFAAYARDVILTRGSTECSKIAQLAGGEETVLKARERLQLLKRTPANTLSSNVAGLQPPQYIAQIFQVIDASRALVSASPSTGLVRGQLTYPFLAQRPIVAVQNSEKTEAGNQGMIVNMETAQAVTYLGGGDLSWQALNWSTPDALALWFQIAASDYALKTEQAAAKAVLDNAFVNVIGSPLSSTPDFATIMTAVGAGYAKVYAESQRLADTLIVSPDRYGYLLGTTSTPTTIFIDVNGQHIGPLNLLTSRGMDSGTMIVGDMKGLLVAETPGAPVELRVVEPAIGGVEVGIIGAFKAVVVDPGAFSLITTAS